MVTADRMTRSVVFSFASTVVSSMACAIFSHMLKVDSINRHVSDVRFHLPFPSHTSIIVCNQLNIHCIKGKFYLFSIAITRNHILVAMQYTLNNLYTNDTLDILIGSLEIWFTNSTRIQLNLHVETKINSNWCEAITHAPFLQYFGL